MLILYNILQNISYYSAQKVNIVLKTVYFDVST